MFKNSVVKKRGPFFLFIKFCLSQDMKTKKESVNETVACYLLLGEKLN